MDFGREKAEHANAPNESDSYYSSLLSKYPQKNNLSMYTPWSYPLHSRHLITTIHEVENVSRLQGWENNGLIHLILENISQLVGKVQQTIETGIRGWNRQLASKIPKEEFYRSVCRNHPIRWRIIQLYRNLIFVIMIMIIIIWCGVKPCKWVSAVIDSPGAECPLVLLVSVFY